MVDLVAGMVHGLRHPAIAGAWKLLDDRRDSCLERLLRLEPAFSDALPAVVPGAVHLQQPAHPPARIPPALLLAANSDCLNHGRSVFRR